MELSLLAFMLTIKGKGEEARHWKQFGKVIVDSKEKQESSPAFYMIITQLQMISVLTQLALLPI